MALVRKGEGFLAYVRLGGWVFGRWMCPIRMHNNFWGLDTVFGGLTIKGYPWAIPFQLGYARATPVYGAKVRVRGDGTGRNLNLLFA